MTFDRLKAAAIKDAVMTNYVCKHEREKMWKTPQPFCYSETQIKKPKKNCLKIKNLLILRPSFHNLKDSSSKQVSIGIKFGNLFAVSSLSFQFVKIIVKNNFTESSKSFMNQSFCSWLMGKILRSKCKMTKSANKNR